MFLRNFPDFGVKKNRVVGSIVVPTLAKLLVSFTLFSQRKQEERVQQVRKKLEEALMADILSRAADAEATGLEVDSGDDA